MKHLNEVHTRLVRITRDCRPDMHEPDEQGIQARIVGTDLDNAMGEQIVPELLIRGAHEFVVIIERDDRSPHIEQFNLADLIALARLVQFP